jgi:hypothetical protein
MMNKESPRDESRETGVGSKTALLKSQKHGKGSHRESGCEATAITIGENRTQNSHGHGEG